MNEPLSTREALLMAAVILYLGLLSAMVMHTIIDAVTRLAQ